MRSIIYMIVTLFLIWIGGYMWYIQKLSETQIDLEIKSDAIVVLTGGINRLKVAVDLLEAKIASKLYVSGVDEKVTRDELLSLLEVSEELAECCIESGQQAADTVGNAIETLEWVMKNNIQSIRVVTSLEHMPRAMVEFNRFMPGIEFIEHPVGAWRPDNINYFTLSEEYSKYIISLLRARISMELYNDAS